MLSTSTRYDSRTPLTYHAYFPLLMMTLSHHPVMILGHATFQDTEYVLETPAIQHLIIHQSNQGPILSTLINVASRITSREARKEQYHC